MFSVKRFNLVSDDVVPAVGGGKQGETSETYQAVIDRSVIDCDQGGVKLKMATVALLVLGLGFARVTAGKKPSPAFAY